MKMMTPMREAERDLCMRMGIALTVWQNVEDQHYHLFLNLVGVTEGKIPSVVYFSNESFDARRVMVHRMVDCFKTTKEMRIEWNELSKQLKDSAENRNKIAHYGIGYSMYEHPSEKDPQKMELSISPPSLVPSAYNHVSKLLGRTVDMLEHNLSAKEVDGYIRDFGALGNRVLRFSHDCGQIQWPNGQVRKPPSPMPEVLPPAPMNMR